MADLSDGCSTGPVSPYRASIAYYQPTSGQIENNEGARMTIDTDYLLSDQ